MCCHSVGCGYDTPDNAIGYAMHSSRSHDAVIRVYDAASNVIESHRHKGDFKRMVVPSNALALLPLKELLQS